jgi:hypothetical protein
MDDVKRKTLVSSVYDSASLTESDDNGSPKAL